MMYVRKEQLEVLNSRQNFFGSVETRQCDQVHAVSKSSRVRLRYSCFLLLVVYVKWPEVEVEVEAES